MTADDVTLTEARKWVRGVLLDQRFGASFLRREELVDVLADRLAAVQAERDEWHNAAVGRSLQVADQRTRAESAERRLAEVEALADERFASANMLHAKWQDAERDKVHTVHVTAEPVAEDVVWCEACEEWVTSGAPEPAALANPPAEECRCQIVGGSRDPYEPHIPAQPEWEQADDCPVHPMGSSADEERCEHDTPAYATCRQCAEGSNPPALAQHDAEAGARALREAADAIQAQHPQAMPPSINFLRARADALTTDTE